MRRVRYIFLVIGAGAGIALLASCHKEEKEKISPPPESAANPIQQDLPNKSTNPATPAEAANPPQDVNTVIAQLEKAWESVKSMQASFTFTVESMTQPPMNNTGTVIYINEGDTGKYKYEGTGRITIGGALRELQGMALYDGVLFHTLATMPDDSKRVEITYPKLFPTPPPGGRLLLDLLRRDYLLSEVPRASGDDKGRILVIEGQAQEDLRRDFGFNQLRAVINKEKGCLVSLEAVSMANGDTWKIEIAPPEFDVAVDPVNFVFAPPPDTLIEESWKTNPQRFAAGL